MLCRLSLLPPVCSLFPYTTLFRSFGVRLPHSQDAATALPFVEPMGYGMAKWGWVGVTFKKGDDVPMKMVMEWLEESYRKRSEEHTSELQSLRHLVCRLLLEKKNSV